jgi:hypothetical protein
VSRHRSTILYDLKGGIRNRLCRCGKQKSLPTFGQARRATRQNLQLNSAEHSRPGLYGQDCLTTLHNDAFIREPRFVAAYQSGIKASGVHHRIHWRVHVALRLASQVRHLPGAFVECGVSTGFLSSAIMQLPGWNSLQKSFYLFDTFCGLDDQLLTLSGKKTDRLSWYKDLSYESVWKNFFRVPEFPTNPRGCSG